MPALSRRSGPFTRHARTDAAVGPHTAGASGFVVAIPTRPFHHGLLASSLSLLWTQVWTFCSLSCGGSSQFFTNIASKSEWKTLLAGPFSKVMVAR